MALIILVHLIEFAVKLTKKYDKATKKELLSMLLIKISNPF